MISISADWRIEFSLEWILKCEGERSDQWTRNRKWRVCKRVASWVALEGGIYCLCKSVDLILLCSRNWWCLLKEFGMELVEVMVEMDSRTVPMPLTSMMTSCSDEELDHWSDSDHDEESEIETSVLEFSLGFGKGFTAVEEFEWQWYNWRLLGSEWRREECCWIMRSCERRLMLLTDLITNHMGEWIGDSFRGLPVLELESGRISHASFGGFYLEQDPPHKNTF